MLIWPVLVHRGLPLASHGQKLSSAHVNTKPESLRTLRFDVFHTNWGVESSTSLVLATLSTGGKTPAVSAAWGDRTRWAFPGLGIRGQGGPAAPLWSPHEKQFPVLFLGHPSRDLLCFVCLRGGRLSNVRTEGPQDQRLTLAGLCRPPCAQVSVPASS